MYNNWLTIGPLTIHGYGVMIAIGILLAFYLGERMAKKHGLSADLVDNIIIVALVSGYCCSKLTYCLINWQAFLDDPAAVLGTGGWVVYGGILGGMLFVWLYCRHKKVSFLTYLNLLVPEVALAQALGRIGCFLAGCCYGIPTNGDVGVVFPEGSLAPAGVSLVPTQLISSLGDFLIFAILWQIYKDEKHRNETGAWYLILYSAGRFGIEFLRGDIERGFIGVLSVSQFLAIFVEIGGWILLWHCRKEEKKTV